MIQIENFQTKSLKKAIAKLSEVALSKYKLVHRMYTDDYADGCLPKVNENIDCTMENIQAKLDEQGFKSFGISVYADGHMMGFELSKNNFLTFYPRK